MHNIFRKWYYYFARPKEGILHLTCDGISSSFHIHTPLELRMIESMGGSGGEQHILKALLQHLRPNDIVYDIGSNVGIYTIFLAKRVGGEGKVIAFEPVSQSYAHLQENIKLNNLHNVYSFCIACGEKDSKEKIYIGDDSASLRLAPPYKKSKKEEVVVIVNGDQFVKSKSLPIPRAVKIDVEGYEYAVILGLRYTLQQPACELVCCEIHPTLLPTGINSDKVIFLLKSLGFTQIELFTREEDTYHALCYKPESVKLAELFLAFRI
jgi:FkbM family methyltransferase